MINKYPYTDFNEYNLDWVIRKMKELIHEWADMQTGFIDLSTQFTDLKNYVDSFFDDLDLQQEVNNTLDAMAADGTLAQILNYNNIDIDLNNITPYAKDVQLTAQTEYAEGVVLFNNNYYVACNDFSTSPAATKVIVYNRDMTLLTSVLLDSAYQIANTVWADENYIYIDFDGGHHVRMDANLNIITSWDDTVRNYCFDKQNGKYYAVEFSGADITVTECTPLFEKIDDTAFTLSGHSGITLQSSFLYNGIIYIATTQGYFRFINIKNQKLYEIMYNDILEIEQFFDVDDKLCAIGHYYGLDGIFSLYNFDGGVPDVIIRNIAYDGSTTRNALIGYTGRYGIYSIENGLSASPAFPADSGELVNYKDFSIFMDKAANRKYYYTNAWQYAGTLKKEYIYPISGDSKILLVLTPDGNMYVRFLSYRVQGVSSVTISYDASDIFKMFGYGDSVTLVGTCLSQKYGSPFNTGDVYGIMVRMSKTQIQVLARNLCDPSMAAASYDAYVSETVRLLY